MFPETDYPIDSFFAHPATALHLKESSTFHYLEVVPLPKDKRFSDLDILYYHINQTPFQ